MILKQIISMSDLFLFTTKSVSSSMVVLSFVKTNHCLTHHRTNVQPSKFCDVIISRRSPNTYCRLNTFCNYTRGPIAPGAARVGFLIFTLNQEQELLIRERASRGCFPLTACNRFLKENPADIQMFASFGPT